MCASVCPAGYYTHVSTLADVQENVMEYLHVLSRPMVINHDHDIIWTEAYMDSVVSLLLPCARLATRTICFNVTWLTVCDHTVTCDPLNYFQREVKSPTDVSHGVLFRKHMRGTARWLPGCYKAISAVIIRAEIVGG